MFTNLSLFFKKKKKQTYTSLSPFLHLTPLVAVTTLQAFAKRLHTTSLRRPSHSPAPHIPLVRLKSTPLIGWFLYTRRVHQMKRTLVLIVKVRVLTTRAKLRRILAYFYKYNI